MALSERLTAATSLTSSLEHLTHRRHARPGGLNDWAIARDNHAPQHPILRKALDLIADERTTTGLHLARVAASVGLLLPGDARWRGAANLFLGLSNAALYPRHRYGTDGADQASTLVQSAVGLARLSNDPRTRDALLWYVAAQSNLSYLISGWVKLLGKDWRSGAALGGVMRTRTYGQEDIWRLTRRYPRAARTLAHGVLALECLFPILYLRGGKLAKPIIGSAAAFHVANGFVMGLGRFATSFTAMHPMVAYTSTPRSHPAAAGRDDRMLGAAALVLAGGVAVAGAVAAGRRLRAVEPWPDGRTVTTRHGNELSYNARLTDRPARADESDAAESTAAESAPVVVFIPGLASTAEHFGWVTEKLLRDSDIDLVTYSRAGYGPSRYRASGPFGLDQAVDDLEDLIAAAVPSGRPVVLAGHSLGGELARRVSARLGDRLHGVVYLDSSHPAELLRSKQQSDSAERLRGGLVTFLNSLRAGMGALLVRPDWVESLPAGYRRKVMAQYADSRLWEAGMREWEATEREFRAFEGELPSAPGHALVLSAQQTVDRDPEQLLMHKELGDAHRAPGRLVRNEVLEGADHDSLLTSARLGTEVGRRIIDFLAQTLRPDAAEPTRNPSLI
ncbi:alpha/beta fold hydrolase, partial [Streptomyces sp. IF17]|nr:alpha/beta fold hydrolase [Streptomyces alkaliphilus]